MEVEQWQKRLEDNFTEGGIVGGPKLVSLLSSENTFCAHISDKYHGYVVLADSFFSFYIETLETAESQARKKGAEADPDYFGILIDYASAFRTFRAAERLLVSGYPLSGYALLRDLKDFALLISGLISGKTTYRKLWGFEDLPEEPQNREERKAVMEKAKKNRKRKEWRVFEAVVGKKSGLEESHMLKLERWSEMFHLEVHGRRLSSVAGLEWIKGERTLPIYPSIEELDIAMYLNRSHEISWLLLRTFLFLQMEASGFGSRWAEKWRILDDSFLIEHQAREKMGKEIASAIIGLVQEKFDYPPEETCYRADS